MKTTEYKPDWIAQHTLQMPLSYKRRNLVGLLTYLLIIIVYYANNAAK